MQRYFSNHKDDHYFILSNDDIYHITKVMRMKNNDKIEVVYNKKLYLCSVENSDGNIKFRIIEEIKTNDNKECKFNLVIPLLKEAKMDLIFQKATELGVNNIYLVPMERSIVKIDQNRLDKKMERWYKICKEASEQSKRIDIPVIHYFNNLKLLENLEGSKIVCSTQKNLDNIRIYLKNSNNYDRINIVIGPEGGITPQEESLLNKIGFKSISLGERIMRVETVPLYVLSVLNYEYME